MIIKKYMVNRVVRAIRAIRAIIPEAPVPPVLEAPPGRQSPAYIYILYNIDKN